jgi:hypothetical protein
VRILCKKWKIILRIYTLVLLFGVGYDRALGDLEGQSTKSLKVTAIAGLVLDDTDRAFSQTSTIFYPLKFRRKARYILTKTIGKSLNPDWPEGFGRCQSLIVLHDNVPDNTLPAINKSGSVRGFYWKALFERTET